MMDSARNAMERNGANREKILQYLAEELVGPAPAGPEVDTSATVIRIAERRLVFGPYREAGTGEEILTRDPPTRRYGIGVLHPWRQEMDEEDLADETALPALADPAVLDMGVEATPVQDRPSTWSRDEVRDDFDLSSANTLKPSTMGVSLLADLSGAKDLVVTATGGRYVKREVAVANDTWPRVWWIRTPVELRATFSAEALLGSQPKSVVAGQRESSPGVTLTGRGAEPLNVQVEVLSRPHGDGTSLLTVCLVNRAKGEGRTLTIERTLFQTHFQVTVQGKGGGEAILPYPMPESRQDPEQGSLDLLYRGFPVFGTGHGCAADWDREPRGNRASWVSAEALPAVRLPTVTPDIRKRDGSPLTVTMRAMTTVEPGDEGWRQLEELASEYEHWIATQEARLGEEIEKEFRETGRQHLDACKAAAGRMRRGLEFLAESPVALQAFQLANEAILLQQINTSRKLRAVSLDPGSGSFVLDPLYEAPSLEHAPQGKGQWRAFQVAFLLASVESTGNPGSVDRDLVDLIWFPTGGGKTEAYLGLAAYSMFKRRLEDPDDTGVHVLMRYTLRLLTAQQFERAASLVCAMEFIRWRELIGPVDREHAFSIGIWVGGDTTPNRRKHAVQLLQEYRRTTTGNPFLIARCPWCAASFGKIPGGKGKGRGSALTPGYQLTSSDGAGESSLGFACPDRHCVFASELPIYLVDEDIYQYQPTMVIATIDKFARLAWSAEPRTMFGLDRAGKQTTSPPGLIIQDELHLISGPLGSLAGMLEPVIEELCTDRRRGTIVRPKIVSSTATIRRYQEQVTALYGRERVALFPPPGLDAGNSFFAVHDPDAIGPMYVGVHAPSFTSYQTEWVRALSALVQAPKQLEPEERDPWWTLLMYCNSIRDMGTAHTLLDSDVRAHFDVIWGRSGAAPDQRRYLDRPIMELTGGLKRSDVTRAMEDLSVGVDSRYGAIDVCLASNIIEVGIDIQRLSLMVVAGQPKTTSQYIQVTGRVGRDRVKPGLIVTLYGPSKPRDRSHFERFRGYHERLYGQVEPTSLTPFSTPALDRSLHAVLVSHVRQHGRSAVIESPLPYPGELVDQAAELLRERASIVDKEALPELDKAIARRSHEWQARERRQWERARDSEDPGLLRRAGEYATLDEEILSWATMTSMRNVDSGCEGQITTQYLAQQLQRDDEADDE